MSLIILGGGKGKGLLKIKDLFGRCAKNCSKNSSQIVAIPARNLPKSAKSWQKRAKKWQKIRVLATGILFKFSKVGVSVKG